MTLTKNQNYFTTASGEQMWMEQYHEKEWPAKVWFWRYGDYVNGLARTISDMLSSRPNKKRLIATY